MEFLRPTNFGPAQQIAERILQLQQQSAQSIGGGIQSATNSIVGGLEKKYALDKAAADKKEGREYAKQENLITVDEPMAKMLGGNSRLENVLVNNGSNLNGQADPAKHFSHGLIDGN